MTARRNLRALSRRWSVAAILIALCAALLACACQRAPLPAANRSAAAVAAAPANADTNATTAAPSSNGDQDDEDDEPADTWPPDADSPEQILYAQPAMVRKAVAALSPPSPGKVNLYLIAFAGDGEEDVFRNEVEYAARLFDRRFDSAGHTLLLVNNPSTLDRYPLASLSNLEMAVDGVAAKMDRERDILLLLLSTHGSSDHVLYVSMDPLPLDQIAPEDLADILARARIRYRAIVISACYSGGFIDALKSPTTLVITAARDDRPSFGCGTDSPITDFGRAFFVDALNRDTSLAAAYADASKLIAEREDRRDEQHSYPQIATADGIRAQLAAWRTGITLGPAVPFRAGPGQDTARTGTSAGKR